jgi:hypothetical protein
MTDSMYQQVYTKSRLLSGVLRRTFHTLKLVPEKFRAAFFRGDPRTVCPRRIVANMLRVSAFQFGGPVAVFVLTEADNPVSHKNPCTL